MTNKNKAKEKFIAFLKINNAYENFTRNFNNREGFRDDVNPKNTFFKDVNPRDYLNIAFTWLETPEGFDYWYELDEKWRQRCTCKY